MKIKIVLLAGPSASGKSSLARALKGDGFVASTSAYLRSFTGSDAPNILLAAGDALDAEDSGWVRRYASRWGEEVPVVVDAIRSDAQLRSFTGSWARESSVLVNVTASPKILAARHQQRGTNPANFRHYQFRDPDFTWDSSGVGVAQAVAAISQLRGLGFVDLVVGGQYGSEGKGKLCAHLAPNYQVLARTGGPNAGHWVREPDREFCFHCIPSGSFTNPTARIVVAAGATVHPVDFLAEAQKSDTLARLTVDPNVVLIQDSDREAEGRLVDKVGSTAQGVGSATARRILRGFRTVVETAADDNRFNGLTRSVSTLLHAAMQSGERVLLEGTQGSGLSLYHGPFPYTTSRDTNVGGLLAEVGLAPASVRDTWMVVRSHPIRVGGNSGPMRRELSWEDIASRSGVHADVLRQRELTSTTRRLRRIGEFDPTQFAQAVALNRPTKLFLTFADYLDAQIAGTDDWGMVSRSGNVMGLVSILEDLASCPVAGISTGKFQHETCWRPGYGPASEKQ